MIPTTPGTRPSPGRLAAIPLAPGPDRALTALGAGARAPATVSDAPPSPPGRAASAHAQDAWRATDVEARTVAHGGPWVARDPCIGRGAGPGGRPSGTIDRMLVAVKDLVAVAGVRLGAGSRTRDAAPAEPRDAAVVARLRAAGAVVAGTVALHELAFGVTGVNDAVGFPRHPDDPDLAPGGSSSGSAVAVALGAVDLAVGTDTGGSVRIPAALCGVVGFKPGRGRYPLDGVFPLAPTLDHVGLLARRVEAVAAAHRALTGEEAARPDPAAGLRLGLDRAALAAADPAVAGPIEIALRALADAGCELTEIDWPDRDEVLDVSTTILLAEAAAVHRDLLDRPEAGLLGAAVHDRLRAGAALTERDHQAGQGAAARIEDHLRSTLATVDAVVGPTVPIPAPPIDAARTDPALARRLVADTRLANVTGVPALSVPVARPAGSAALPVGLQVIAATDARTLAAGAAIAAVVGEAHQ